MERVIAYIDGFNLYYGIKSKGWRRYYWLNPRRLIQNLLKPGQTLVFTEYFTARISNNPGDLVSLVRFAIHQDNEPVPFPERVNANFKAWLAGQEGSGKKFTKEQRRWLEMIRDHIAANLGIEPDDFELSRFAQEGGPGKVHQIFGDKLKTIIEELNETLAA